MFLEQGTELELRFPTLASVQSANKPMARENNAALDVKG